MPVTNYIWDIISDNILLESTAEGQFAVCYTYEARQFGAPLSQNRDDCTRYIHFDGDGHTTALTNVNEDITDTYAYTSFGAPASETGTTHNPYRYNGAFGYYFNVTTNDIYVRVRTYSPILARWLSVDPVGTTETPNAFLYFENQPIATTDPSGLFPLSGSGFFPAIVGFLDPLDVLESFQSRSLMARRELSVSTIITESMRSFKYVDLPMTMERIASSSYEYSRNNPINLSDPSGLAATARRDYWCFDCTPTRLSFGGVCTGWCRCNWGRGNLGLIAIMTAVIDRCCVYSCWLGRDAPAAQPGIMARCMNTAVSAMGGAKARPTGCTCT
jgi:RHS repeat-associated protein